MYVLPNDDITYLQQRLLDDAGQLRILPYAELAAVSQEHISLFCVKYGFYCIPTQELVEWIAGRMGMPAIEIGSGNGVLAQALGIPATDNRMQEWPEIAAHYKLLGQQTIRYGANVENLPALEAVERYQPHTVVAAWVTHLYNPKEHWREGNQFGVDERALLRKVRRYIFVGNESTHGKKPILQLPKQSWRFPWLLSRSMNPAENVIWMWERA